MHRIAIKIELTRLWILTAYYAGRVWLNHSIIRTCGKVEAWLARHTNE